MSSRNRRRHPRVVLETLVGHPPSRLRDRTLDTDGSEPPPVEPSLQAETVDIACWTPVAPSADDAASGRELRATLLAESPLPDTSGPITHTLVLEVDEPMASVELDYRSLDGTVVPERSVRGRTDANRPVPVAESRVADDGTFVVTFADPPTDGALFLEYSVTQNPEHGRHAVGVVVDGERRTEARLVVVG